MSIERCAGYNRELDQIAQGGITRDELVQFGETIARRKYGFVTASCGLGLRDRLVAYQDNFRKGRGGMDQESYDYLVTQIATGNPDNVAASNPYYHLFYSGSACDRGLFCIQSFPLTDPTVYANQTEALWG